MLMEVSAFGIECRRYQFEFLESLDGGNLNKEEVKEKAYLINIFFEFIGFSQKQNKYRLSPDLLSHHKKEHEEY